MKKEFVDMIVEFGPLIVIVSLLASWLKGAKTMVEYLKSLIASFILGIPAACLVEYFGSNPDIWLLKYVVVLAVGVFGICIFNGTFKIFKRYEDHPKEVIDEAIEKVDKIKEVLKK